MAAAPSPVQASEALVRRISSTAATRLGHAKSSPRSPARANRARRATSSGSSIVAVRESADDILDPDLNPHARGSGRMRWLLFEPGRLLFE